jgi:hypothetical protein
MQVEQPQTSKSELKMVVDLCSTTLRAGHLLVKVPAQGDIQFAMHRRCRSPKHTLRPRTAGTACAVMASALIF